MSFVIIIFAELMKLWNNHRTLLAPFSRGGKIDKHPSILSNNQKCKIHKYFVSYFLLSKKSRNEGREMKAD